VFTTVRQVAATFVVVAVVGLLSACGPLDGPAQGREDPNSPDATIVAMIDCFRAHGLPNFPDPAYDPSDGRWHLPNERPDITVQVQQACASVMPHQVPGTPIPTAQLHDLLGYAACMRAHGMPNFPDPGADGVFHGTQQTIGSKTDPAANAASAACEQFLASSGGHIQVSN